MMLRWIRLRPTIFAAFLFVIGLGLEIPRCAFAIAAAPAQVQACFSPHVPGQCDPQFTILRNIAGAKSAVLVLAYLITNYRVADALIAAHDRGVDVRVIIDRHELKDPRYNQDRRQIRSLQKAGIPVLMRIARGLMHDKVMIIDDRTVLTGSYNYTWRAESENAENLVVIHSPVIANQYERYWNTIAVDSQKLPNLR